LGASAVGGTRARRWRLLLLLAVAAALTPGTWIKTPRGELTDNRQILAAERLPELPRKVGVFEVGGVWRLQSPNRHFGGYSALLMLDSGRLLAVSDSGRRVEFTPPDEGPTRPQFNFFVRPTAEKLLHDAESLTRDPASGQLWAGYEQKARIERLDDQLRPTGAVSPPEMRGWPSNAGAEAMVHLADGRFVVLAESDPDWLADDRPGLLFPSDPVAGSTPLAFRFAGPDGYEPTDMAQLPDGRVLILLRAIDLLPPRIAGKLLLADPAKIRPGEPWRGEAIATLEDPFPPDNYEGIAIVPSPGGDLVIWLISDDNRSAYLQQTLLAKLVWRNEKGARTGRAPR